MRVQTQQWNEFWYQLMLAFFQFFLLFLFLYSPLELLFPGLVTPHVSLNVLLAGALASGAATFLLFQCERVPLAVSQKDVPQKSSRQKIQNGILIGILAITGGGFVFFQSSTLGSLGTIFSLCIVLLVGVLGSTLYSEHPEE